MRRAVQAPRACLRRAPGELRDTQRAWSGGCAGALCTLATAAREQLRRNWNQKMALPSPALPFVPLAGMIQTRKKKKKNSADPDSRSGVFRHSPFFTASLVSRPHGPGRPAGWARTATASLGSCSPHGCHRNHFPRQAPSALCACSGCPVS